MAPRADRIDVRRGVGGALSRLLAAWRGLHAVQRLAVYGALGLFVTMLLPWYSKSAVGVSPSGKPVKAEDTLNAFQAFSFVEAAVLLVAVGVIVLLLARGEGRAFHLPGGDGTVILAAGIWVCLLVFYRQFDKPGADSIPGLATTVGVTWGIFVTFLCGLFLAYAGTRLRAAHVTEPPLPADIDRSDPPRPAPGDPPPPSGPGAAPSGQPARTRPSREQALTVVDPNDATISTRVAPRRPERPSGAEAQPPAGGEPTPGQLSFDQDERPRGGER